MIDRHRIVAEQTFKGVNMLDAGKEAGYKGKTVSSQVSKILKRPDVVAYINELRSLRVQTAVVDSNILLERLADIAQADMLDIITDIGTFKPMSEWPLIWRKMVKSISVKQTFAGSGKDKFQDGEIITIRMVDPLQVLRLIGEHTKVGAFNKVIDVNINYKEMKQELQAGRDRAAIANKSLEIDSESVTTTTPSGGQDFIDAEVYEHPGEE